jgi:hypothetical protein
MRCLKGFQRHDDMLEFWQSPIRQGDRRGGFECRQANENKTLHHKFTLSLSFMDKKSRIAESKVEIYNNTNFLHGVDLPRALLRE